ncbi:LacI family DNA-binding transcriptional regulator [Spongiactinospora sp. TRM90649]|uniref:LacI family DNA-binding transcriptional regulator n=1 Tax=Spongiactinospora sp. TRM90649 TaxID=3031114 RepID=UPI0023F925CB|nr:LacI family DNA-binding transcriptional regulator [Spongiactinospora sp. TRM90649]MDF5751029.1 LacI family DNA-binding transcriptional regulator [Spongiactinospora sp. TRM90649]
MKRPTLEAVAARAGVSRATVSRVVNGRSTVTPSIRDMVQRAVEEMGYVPNSAARSLVTQRTDSIALVISEPPTRAFSEDPMFAAVVRTVSRELEAADKQVVLLLAGTAQSHARIERYIAGGHVDGVILISMNEVDPLPGAVLRLGVPVVSYGRPAVPVGLRYAGMPYVDNDNVRGAREAVGRLLELGRRRIATIAGPSDMVAGRDRLSGYHEALRGSGVRPVVATGDFTRESGGTAMRRLLADEPEIDAVFAAGDLMAVGALRALRQSGRRVPDDVAVIGYDDIEAARYTDPPLTTMRQPFVEQAVAMVRLLLTDPDERESDRVILSAELVVRQSA